MHTDLVIDVLQEALYAKQPDQDRRVHHSDRGAQYSSTRCAERQAEAGIEPSVDNCGDSYETQFKFFPER